MARGRRSSNDPPPPPPWQTAWAHVAAQPAFSSLRHRTHLQPARLPRDRWALVDNRALIHVNADRGGSTAQWAYVLSAALLHLGYGHHLVPADADPLAWNLACDLEIGALLGSLPGQRTTTRPTEDGGRRGGGGAAWSAHDVPDAYRLPEDRPKRFDARSQWRTLLDSPLLADYRGGEIGPPVPVREQPWLTPMGVADWQRLLAAGISRHAADAIDQVAADGGWRDLGPEHRTAASAEERAAAGQARLVYAWVLANFPLLSALAAGFKVVTDVRGCRARQIEIAAVDAGGRTIYINPTARLDDDELRFVMAHEILHVALQHVQRRQGRDPEVWNVAADYVINAWLVEMGIGKMPQMGLLHDPDLAGQSADEVYARLTQDLRRTRKLIGLRGRAGGDVLDMGDDPDRTAGASADAADWVRGALRQGLELHHQRGRGTLPAGLREEIEAIAADPVPWDAQLAEWFQRLFPPVSAQRSYARASRRQSAAPDVAMPGRADRATDRPSRVFGVLLDTSASMSAAMLGLAVGAIRSYAMAHDVDAVRLVDCDAQPNDRGWVDPSQLAGKVEVTGRGGTTLQPGLDLLDELDDLPPDAPVMLLTDGMFEARLTTGREHCYVMPPGSWLWWPTDGPVFHIA